MKKTKRELTPEEVQYRLDHARMTIDLGSRGLPKGIEEFFERAQARWAAEAEARRTKPAPPE